jgi:hypothetical protein
VSYVADATRVVGDRSNRSLHPVERCGQKTELHYYPKFSIRQPEYDTNITLMEFDRNA